MARKKTQKEFIDECHKIHGSTYSYDRVKYVGSATKVIITCKTHGDFLTFPSNFLKGKGCKKCATGWLTDEQFKSKAKSIHNDKYDYSESTYNGTLTKTIIICPIHGKFKQTPSKHLKGAGCPECSFVNRRVSKESFIKKSRLIHGDKYDYSISKITFVTEPVKIRCPDHGIFEQTPSSHYNGSKCPECSKELSANKRRVSSAELLNKFKQVHGNRYSYKLSDFKGVEAIIKIECPDHGIFEQTPKSHINGSTCPKCARLKASQTRIKNRRKAVIDEFHSVHNHKYSYAKFKYLKASVKSIITCPEHGDFKMTPNSHLGGTGCPECGLIRRAKKRRVDEAILLKWMQKMHKGRYDYSEAEFFGSTKKVKIICTIHGAFMQSPESHLIGRGCPKCGDIISRDAKVLSLDDFIKRSGEIHDYKYSYKQSVYKNSHTKIKIHCPDHGLFHQTPTSHLSGSGCPKCASHGFKRSDKGVFYIHEIYSNKKRGLKIGITKDFHSRKRNIEIGLTNGYRLNTLAVFSGKGDDLYDLEYALKSTLEVGYFDRSEVEDGHSETIEYSDQTLSEIIEILNLKLINVSNEYISPQ